MKLLSTRLLTPGPTPIPDRVRLAMAEPMIHHRKPDFMSIMEETQGMLRRLFGTEQVVLPLSCSGTGAMTAAVHGLFEKGEKVLVAEAGKFGERWAEIAVMRGLEVVTLSAPWGRAIAPERVAAALDADPAIRGVLIQLSETSTGVQHPVREIAELTRHREVMLVADGISSVGIAPTPMDEWGLDCLITGSQKGLMVPPGLSLLALSARAWERAAGIAPSCFYFNLLQEKAMVLNKRQTLFTSPISLIVGLREALRMLFEAGLPELYAKQRGLTAMARAGVSAMGLELFAPDHYTLGLTSVKMPEGLASSAVTKKAAELGVIMSTGQAPMKDETLRLAHMGWVDWADILAGLHALQWAVESLTGRKLPSGALDAAMAAWHESMKESREEE